MIHTKDKNTVLIGCDSPQLDTQILTTALQQLKSGHDAVIGPACDGGYYLIGLSEPELFFFNDIEWGSDQVFTNTMVRFKKNQLKSYLLPLLSDIDRPEDLAQLKSELLDKGIIDLNWP